MMAIIRYELLMDDRHNIRWSVGLLIMSVWLLGRGN